MLPQESHNDSSKSGATASSRMNFSGYVRTYVTTFIQMLIYCMQFSRRLRVRIRFSVWLVSGYKHVFTLLPPSLSLSLMLRS